MSAQATKDDLIVVIPVYNESGAIEVVIADWSTTLATIGAKFHIHVYNDGSKDDTAAILAKIAPKYPQLVVHNKQNSGHGPTILQGYRENGPNAEWLFQVDSDNEMTAEFFPKLWEKRADYDFLVGHRHDRVSPLPRQVVSLVSRAAIRLLYGKGIFDVNTPYRLMRVAAFLPYFSKIPADTFAPNVIISGIAAKEKLRCFQLPVSHKERETGEVSIKKWKLLKVAAKSLWQTISFRLIA